MKTIQKVAEKPSNVTTGWTETVPSWPWRWLP